VEIETQDAFEQPLISTFGLFYPRATKISRVPVTSPTLRHCFLSNLGRKTNNLGAFSAREKVWTKKHRLSPVPNACVGNMISRVKPD
jgi:hypothetical protein